MHNQVKVTSFLKKAVTVTIDRPLGSTHPESGFIYPVNYGFVPGTRGRDGEELDCYVLGVFEPVIEFTGYCIAAICRIDDNDDALVVVPEGKMYTDEQIEALTEFQERFFQSVVVRDL